MQQTLGRPVRDGPVTPEPPGDPGRHLGGQHVRSVRVHVQGRGARVTGCTVLVPEGSRVSAGQGIEYRTRETSRST